MDNQQTARALDGAFAAHVGERFKEHAKDDSPEAAQKFEDDVRRAQDAHDKAMSALQGERHEAGSDDEYRIRLAKHARNERERVDTLVAAGKTLDVIGQRYGVERNVKSEEGEDKEQPEPPKEMSGHMNPSAVRVDDAGGPKPAPAFGPSATRNKSSTGPGYDGPVDGAGETKPKK